MYANYFIDCLFVANIIHIAFINVVDNHHSVTIVGIFRSSSPSAMLRSTYRRIPPGHVLYPVTQWTSRHNPDQCSRLTCYHDKYSPPHRS